MNRVFLSAALLASTAACATILDFQEPVDRVDAADGVDANAPDPSRPEIATTSSSSSSSSSTSGSAVTTSPTDAGGDEADVAVVELGTNECSCFPGAPAGWFGPYVVSAGAECLKDGHYPVEAYFGHSGGTHPPAECSCSCGSPTGVACSTPTTSIFSDAMCSTVACHVDSETHSCSEPLACDVGWKKVAAVSIGPSTPSAGRCDPSATAVVPAATWDKTIRLCAPTVTASKCDAGGVCQPTPSPLFSTTNRCVTKQGDVPSCPAMYPVRQVYRSGSADTRACSKCECDGPSGVTCTATVSVWTGACKEAPAADEAPTGCLAIPSNGRVLTTAGTPSGGSCTAKGGEPIGDFDEGKPTTVCCLHE